MPVGLGRRGEVRERGKMTKHNLRKRGRGERNMSRERRGKGCGPVKLNEEGVPRSRHLFGATGEVRESDKTMRLYQRK